MSTIFLREYSVCQKQLHHGILGIIVFSLISMVIVIVIVIAFVKNKVVVKKV